MSRKSDSNSSYSYYNQDYQRDTYRLDRHSAKSHSDPRNARIRPGKKSSQYNQNNQHQKLKNFDKHKKHNFKYNDDFSDNDNDDTSSVMDDDIESILSENDPDFQEMLKEEFSFDTKWKDSFRNWFKTITSYSTSLFVASPPSSILVNTQVSAGDYKQSIATKGLSMLLNLCFFLLSSIISFVGIATSIMLHIDWKDVLDNLDSIDLKVQEWIKTIDNPNSNKSLSLSVERKTGVYTSDSCRRASVDKYSLYDSDPKVLSSASSPGRYSSDGNVNHHRSSSSSSSHGKKTTKYRECIDDYDYDHAGSEGTAQNKTNNLPLTNFVDDV